MGKIPSELRETIAKNIRDCRMKKFPGRGGGKKCAESFGVSPQQWSPWERGMRTPDELRLSQIADFFGVSVEYLRRDNAVRSPESMLAESQPQYGMGMGAGCDAAHPIPPMLREPDAPPYGLPSLRREDTLVSLNSIAELAQISGRLLVMLSAMNKGVVEGRFDAGKTGIVLRRIADILEQKLREADIQNGNVAIGNGY